VTVRRIRKLQLQALDGVVGGLCDLADQSSALQTLARYESSGGNPHLKNPTTTAFGVGQLIQEHRLNFLGDDYDTTDCNQQVAAMQRYIKGRYGTDDRALSAYYANGSRRGWKKRFY
jgi:hypothetical protein